MPFDLSGRIALVTGGASGIGEATCYTLASAGALVYVADRELDGAERVAAAIRSAGGQSAAMRVDVTVESDCAEAADTVTAAHKRLDVLVNNAGIGHVGTIHQTTGADLDRLYTVNVRGVFNMTKAFIPGMIARHAGAIVNTASIGGIIGIKDRLAYCTTKFAVVGLTKCLALDHAMEGIRVNCVCPGRVETPFVKQRLKEYPDPEAAYREMAATQAIGRMGTPEEIAASILYLASDEAAFITGSALIIDGGWSAGT
jgi:NAD(P)-dependent dehydrogenase (short-subunit alcohol dehydrogenase family)